MSDANFAIQYTPVVKYPPTCSITRPTKDTTVVAGQSMTFEGTGTDTDGYISNYVWKTGDGRVVKGVAKKFDHIYTIAGTYHATLQVQDNDTLWSAADSVLVTVLPSTGVGEERSVPHELMLYPNYPNPFNAGTVITYSLDRAMHVRLGVYSVTGEEVGWLTDGVEAAGTHRVEWTARNKEGRELASGMYICRLMTPEAVRIQKVLLVR
jgi:hypothetical protein